MNKITESCWHEKLKGNRKIGEINIENHIIAGFVRKLNDHFKMDIHSVQMLENEPLCICQSFHSDLPWDLTENTTFKEDTY